MIFKDVERVCRPRTIITPCKFTFIFNELTKLSAKNLEGCIAEVGCYNGGVSKMMSMILPNNKLYMYDSFGIVNAKNDIDFHKDGEFIPKYTYEETVQYINNPNCVFRKGTFPDTFEEGNETFLFIHTDTDTYQGTVDTIRVFEPLLARGGMIVHDDYGIRTCPGVTQACDEYKGSLKKIITECRNMIMVKE